MSRTYKIKVSESLSHHIKVDDGVQTQLEILSILPCDQMAEMLAAELEKDGFEREGDTCKKVEDGTEITVDLHDGQVTVRQVHKETLELEATQEARGYDDVGPSEKSRAKQVKKKLKAQLEGKAAKIEEKAKKKVTEALEKKLPDIQKKLDKVVNRVTAQALKQKAAQMGEIEEISEGEDGSLTIKVRV